MMLGVKRVRSVEFDFAEAGSPFQFVGRGEKFIHDELSNVAEIEVWHFLVSLSGLYPHHTWRNQAHQNG